MSESAMSAASTEKFGNLVREPKLKAGVIGWPISHTLSPTIHNYWLEKTVIQGSYEAIPVEPQNLGIELKRLQAEGYKGINVTIPHKETIMAHLDEVDEIAQFLGAVNAVTFKGNKMIGTNTDILGFRTNLAGAGFIEGIAPRGLPGKLKGRDMAVVLGAGGAARAIVKCLLDAGFKKIVIANRTRERAEKLKTDFANNKIMVFNWGDKEKLLSQADLLVNTTSLGMKGQEPLKINIGALGKESCVIDIVYNPRNTELLVAAQKLGIENYGGLTMLLGQAKPCFEKWFNAEIPSEYTLNSELFGKLANKLGK